jgi:hypothetical protein
VSDRFKTEEMRRKQRFVEKKRRSRQFSWKFAGGARIFSEELTRVR